MTEAVEPIPTEPALSAAPAGPLPCAFPVVGMGASAGGLEAIVELLSALRPDCGMALLVVQHLDPNRASLLSEILSRNTSLPAVEAVEGMAIAPNHVYVIPPNTSMSLTGCHLTLRGRRHIGPPMPVDDLFESLARGQGSNAIAVVLSGGGTDGAIGLQVIKERGGITFAQDERTAQFSGMPRAAVELGCVDLVLPPKAIAQELTRMARHPYLAPDPPATGDVQQVRDERLLGELFRRLRAACNIDFSHYKRGTIERRLARRLALRSLTDLSSYLQFIEREPAEAHALCRDLLIRYTEFFRDPGAFAALTELALPRLLQGVDATSPLRVWVPGCSTGEEVYSLAICLHEHLSRHAVGKPLQIFGTDIGDDALNVARAGRYIENIARSVSAERLQRYFVREGDRYRVSKAIRDCCTFARQNVAYDPPFSRIDLISCRNLLIYLDPALQKAVFPSLHFALRHEGMLMLGMAETIGAHSELFAALETHRAKLYVKKPAPRRLFGQVSRMPVASPRHPHPASPGEPALEPGVSKDVASLQDEIARLMRERYVPPSVLCDEAFNVIEFHGDTSAFLVLPPGTPTNQLQRLARPHVLVAIGDATRQVRRDGGPVRSTVFDVDVAGQPRRAVVDVVPITSSHVEGSWYVVFFVVLPGVGPEDRARPSWWQGVFDVLGSKSDIAARARGEGGAAEIERLQEELRVSREQIRVMLEEHDAALAELRTLSEEALSSNEEYQSTNEELETTKEELQSLNEELTSSNDELQFRNRELKLVYDTAAQARDYADALFETMAEPLLVLDADLRVQRANVAYYERFQCTAAETLHGHLYTIGNRQWDGPELRTLLEEVLPLHKRVRDHEMHVNFAHRGLRTMRFNASRVAWPEHTMILLSIEDVTERRRALDDLAEAARQKDRFLAMLAHELRNPLAVMSNSLILWNHRNSTPEAKRSAVATLERQVRNQERMVEDLLDVSRITRGVVALHVEANVDFAGVVRQAHEALSEQFVERGLQSTIAVPSEPIVVNGDRTRLEQIVTNLLNNAIKFTPHGGRIDTVLAREGKQAKLSVTDSGVGMPAAFIPSAFNVFAQADQSLERQFGGLGIGLAVVRSLVELHGGSVQAYSAGHNEGSRFDVRLPLA